MPIKFTIDDICAFCHKPGLVSKKIKRCRLCHNEIALRKYHQRMEDPEYREKRSLESAKYQRTRLKEDPIYKDNLSQKRRDNRIKRLEDDPEYRDKLNANARKYYDRVMADDDYREKYNIKKRKSARLIYHRLKKTGKYKNYKRKYYRKKLMTKNKQSLFKLHLRLQDLGQDDG